jgi:hypothetical protein
MDAGYKLGRRQGRLKATESICTSHRIHHTYTQRPTNLFYLDIQGLKMGPKSFRELLGMPANTASTSDSALIIIDAQNEYASGALAVTDPAASVKAISDLLEKYRAANGKVIHVCHRTPEGAPIFTPGTDLAEEFKELKAKVRSQCLYSHMNVHQNLTPS